MTDFEIAIRNSFRLFWPRITLLGYYFHFSQLIWRRVKKEKLTQSYEREDDFNWIVRIVSGLPFTPPSRIDEAFAIFRFKAQNVKKERLRDFSQELVNYAEDQWRKGPFVTQDWNFYNMNCILVPSTNNG